MALGLGAALGITGGTALLGGLAGRSQRKAQEQANQDARLMARQGANLLAPSTADFRGQFQALQALSAPQLSMIAAGQDLAGQQAATGAQASLARAGLGSTGLGTALGAGARAGAAFQGNLLRARMLQDMLRQTQNIQAQRGSFLAGVPTQPVQGGFLQGALGGAGGGLTALDAIGAFNGGGGED